MVNDADSAVLYREADVETLQYLIKSRPPLSFVNGTPGCGKTFTLTRTLSNLENVALVDMRGILKPAGFYHLVLSKFGGSATTPDSVADFVRILNSVLPSGSEAVLVVLGCELLCDLSRYLICSVSRLGELTRDKISVILVSSSPWQLLTPSDRTLPPPVTLHFQPYTRSELIGIITHHTLLSHLDTCQELDLTDRDVTGFVRSCIVDTLSQYTSSLREMIQTAHQMFPRYFQPVSEGTLAPSDAIKLFQRVQGELVEVAGKLSRVPGFRTTLELPYTSRVLLMAAFLASHNPARLDKRFFCKGKSSRRKVRSRKGGAKEGMKGPKSFPLERLVAIYSSITQDSSIPCSDVMGSLSTLTTLNLVARSSVDLLEQPKFKCLVNLATVTALAKETGVDFDRFYYNY